MTLVTTTFSHSSLVFCGIAPHPPIMVPEVGRDAIENVRHSIDAMRTLTRRVIDSGAKTVILISPHAPLEAESFVAYPGPWISADFANFRAPGTGFTVEVDTVLLDAISQEADERCYAVQLLDDNLVDHGTAVPLYFLLKYGWTGRVVALGYSFLSNEDHLAFGDVIKNAVDQIGKRVAIIASGDLSHRLKLDAPAGYSPNAHFFDEEVVKALRDNTPQHIVEIDHQLRRLAGECGYRSMLIAIGTIQQMNSACEVFSYEAPFGVGYLVAQLMNGTTHAETDDLPLLARLAVERFITEGTLPDVSNVNSTFMNHPAPCFVSLKTLDGELRGCIGTIEPAKQTLAEEIVANAVSAATRDPRFLPVEKHELSNLRYSVDVLMPAEPATMDQLDPKIYGVIVEDPNSSRRGLLLPDISGVDTALQQVEIASRKAGIVPKVPVQLYRFKVERFREQQKE
ncbi:MAG: AMMECR1 domain-containing protein [Blastocatellia bacterium]|nr:MAG: AMMECR1 domain-containing protein [Blastocatellia bacterium]